jgi:hypothetical protein
MAIDAFIRCIFRQRSRDERPFGNVGLQQVHVELLKGKLVRQDVLQHFPRNWFRLFQGQLFSCHLLNPPNFLVQLGMLCLIKCPQIWILVALVGQVTQPFATLTFF